MFDSGKAVLICFYIEGVKEEDGRAAYNQLTSFIMKNKFMLQSLESVDSLQVFLGFLSEQQTKNIEMIYTRIEKYKRELEIEYDVIIPMIKSPLCTTRDMLIHSYRDLTSKLRAQQYSGINYDAISAHMLE